MQIGGLKPPNNVFLAYGGRLGSPMRELAVELRGVGCGEMQTADLKLAHTRKTVQRQQHSPRAGLRSVNSGLRPVSVSRGRTLQRRPWRRHHRHQHGLPGKSLWRAAGSALLADEALVGQILDAVVSAVDVPVTLKIRRVQTNTIAMASRSRVLQRTPAFNC